MDLSDAIRIAAPRDDVFAALNDTDVLARSIPGCESLERVSDTELAGTVLVKVGPVRAKFKGSVVLSDMDPPAGYTIAGEGKGGAAGYAKGRAQVSLAEDGDATRLSYRVHADVGGKLAQLGGRLLEQTARKLAGEFFNSLEANMAAVAAGEPAPAPEPAEPAAGIPGWAWIAAAIAAVAAALFLLAP